MAYQPLFVASVLSGFEDTIETLRKGTENRDLRAGLDVLDTQVKSLRLSIDPDPQEVTADSMKPIKPAPCGASGQPEVACESVAV